MGLPLPWVRHLRDQDSKDKLERSVRASATALLRLYDLVEEDEKAIHTLESQAADFETSSWAYKQAFRNGQKAQIRQLKQLLGFLKDKD